MLRIVLPRLGILLISLVLFACSSSDMADLKDYAEGIKKRENPKVDPLPVWGIEPSFFYEASNLTDPFKPFLETREKTDEPDPTTVIKNCWRPDPNRIRAGLELMPVDALKMVGTIYDDQSKTLLGLVMSKNDGTVYQVKQGDLLGDNFGRINNVSEERIELMEMQPDGQGCYAEKQVSIALSSQQ